MLWTEEAIEILKRLAFEGKSASAIASALGAASRGAVIGKANRIGVRLNGDGRAPAAGLASARGYRESTARPERVRQIESSDPALPGRLRTRPRRTTTKAVCAFADAEVGDMRRVTFQDIRHRACRWPLGDPRSGDFVFCGLPPAEGRSYCAGHCRMAYRPD